MDTRFSLEPISKRHYVTSEPKTYSFPLRGKARMGVGLNIFSPIPTPTLPLKGRETIFEMASR
jgi:hypothetical protein